MAVGRRKRRQESERLVAQIAAPAPNRNPVMIFVVRLFPATAMTDNRIALTNRALAQDLPSTSLDPIDFEVALRGRKWDKQNRDPWGLCRG